MIIAILTWLPLGLCAQLTVAQVNATISQSIEKNGIFTVYRSFVREAQANTKDPLSRYGATIAFCEMLDLRRHGLGTFDIDGERMRVKRMADDAIRLDPSRAYPILAKMRLAANMPELTGPRHSSEPARREWIWQTITNTRTGEVRRERVLAYVYDGPNAQSEKLQAELLREALELEPNNPAVLLVAAQVEETAGGKLKHVRAARAAGARETFPTTYLLAAYKAYTANKLTKDAAIAKTALRRRLDAAEGKMWVKLFRKQHRDFAK